MLDDQESWFPERCLVTSLKSFSSWAIVSALEDSIKRFLRIQRNRYKGWRTPPNTVYVGRGTKWANPYLPGISVQTRKDGTYQRMTAEEALLRYCQDLPFFLDPTTGHLDLAELRGKNLMCWCKIGTPCHADILLALANGYELDGSARLACLPLLKARSKPCP